MNISDYNRSPLWQVTYDVTISGTEWQERVMKVAWELQKTNPVPGFRAGKAPIGTCVKHYGIGLLQQAMYRALPDIVAEASAGRDDAPVSEPALTALSLTEQKCQAHCSYFVYPVVRDLPWRGLKAERPQRTCTEADVDAAIDAYMRQHLNVHPVERPARMDDIVEVCFSGTHDGGPFPYDHAEKSRFRLGSGQLFAGLDEALVGHIGGEELSLRLTMPENFHREEIRGFTLDLQVRLLGVWERELLACTDDYVREHVKDCETLAQFREQKMAELQKRCEEQSNSIFDRNLHKALADLVTCQLPPCMMEQMLTDMMNNLELRARQEGFAGAKELLTSEGRTTESYLAQCRPIADQHIRESVALDYIARTEQIQVTQEEFAAYVGRNMRMYKADYDRTLEILGGTDSVAEVLSSRKAMELVHQAACPVPTDGTDMIRI